MKLLFLGDAGSAKFADGNARVRLNCVPDWPAVLQGLAAEPAPATLIISARRLDERGTRLLELLHRRGDLCPTAIYFDTVDPDLVRRTWALGKLSIKPLFSDAHIAEHIANLSDIDGDFPSRWLRARSASSCSVVEQLFSLLTDNQSMRTASVHDLLKELRMSRATLYSRVARKGLPGIEHIQALFKLWPAIRKLQAGESASAAASSAGFATPRGLRRGLEVRFGILITDLRENHSAGWAMQRWADHHEIDVNVPAPL